MEDKIKYIDPTSSFEYMSKDEAIERFGKEFVEQQLNKNMETQPTQSSTLNERILKVIKNYRITEESKLDFNYLANAIEALIIEEVGKAFSAGVKRALYPEQPCQVEYINQLKNIQ